jgi:hypothetical protein
MRNKPVLCMDFDGVVHKYISGWQGIDKIIDPPVDGALVFLNAALEFFDVNIFSSRSSAKAGRDAMMIWFIENGWAEEITVSADRAQRHSLEERVMGGMSRPEHYLLPKSSRPNVVVKG